MNMHRLSPTTHPVLKGKTPFRKNNAKLYTRYRSAQTGKTG
jgi:hypothetical protein